MKNLLLRIMLPMLLLASISNQTIGQVPTALSDVLQFKLDSVRIEENLKGVSSAIVIPGLGTWLGVSGISHAGVDIAPDFRFTIASNTKTYTSVLLLKLQELGVLDLDDEIGTWLPGLSVPNIDPTVTIRQLLKHTSGIYNINDWIGYKDSLNGGPLTPDYDRYWTTDELFEMVGPAYFPKGTAYHYSNTNYILAGMIIESSTGSSFSNQLHSLILTPGGLSETYVEGEEPVPGNIAHPWDNGSVTFTTGDIFALPRTSFNSHGRTAGCIKATAQDQAKWYQYIFNGGCLNASSINELLDVYAISPVYGYGLGMMRDSYTFPPHVYYFHSGNFDNVSTTIIDSIHNVSICLQINESSTSIGSKPYAHILLKTVLKFMDVNSGLVDSYVDASLDVKIYPVPAREVCFLDVVSETDYSVELCDVFGKVIITGQNLTELNLDALDQGIYFVKIEDDMGRQITRRLQVE